MEKRRVTCARCGAVLLQPATGRPRVYCSALCRRDAEYRLRRVQSHLARAERSLTTARMTAATASRYGYRDDAVQTKERIKFWTAEVEALTAELRAALVDLSQDEEEAPRPALRATG